MDRTRRRKGAIVALFAAIATSTFVVQHKRAQDAAEPTASAAAAARVQPAVRALMALPELKAWSAAIERSSGGKSHGAVVLGNPAPRTIGGKSYMAYSFVENEPEAAHFWQGFYVTDKGDSILVEDAATGNTMSVAEWREKEHPLDRIKADTAESD